MSANATVPGWSAAWASAAPGGGGEGPVDPARAPAGHHPRVRLRRQGQIDIPHRQRVTAPQQRFPGQRGDKFAGNFRLRSSPPRQASSTAVAAAPAAASALRHCASHGPAAGSPADARSGAPVSLTAAATSVAARCGSAHIPGPCAITTCLTGEPRPRPARGRGRAEAAATADASAPAGWPR